MKHRPWLTLPSFPSQFPLSTDSVLLADFVTLPPKARVFDLGAGPGTLGLLLCAKDETCRVRGIELQPQPAARAAQLAEVNHMEDRVLVYEGDLCKIKQWETASQYDVVVANPPYFPAGCGAVAADESLAIARTELRCTLSDICAAAAHLLRHGGSFFLVHRPERLAEAIAALSAQQLEPKRLRLVRHHCDAAPSLALLESRLGGKPGLIIETDLLLQDASGGDSPEYRRIYGFGGST